MRATAGDNTNVGISNHTTFVTGVHAFKKYLHNFNVLDCNGLKSPGWYFRIVLHAASGASAVASIDANTSAHTIFVAGMCMHTKCLHVFNVLHYNRLKSPVRSCFYVEKV